MKEKELLRKLVEDAQQRAASELWLKSLGIATTLTGVVSPNPTAGMLSQVLGTSIDDALGLKRSLNYEKKYAELLLEVEVKHQELLETIKRGKNQEAENERLKLAIDKLQAHKQFGFLLSRVNSQAQDLLMESEDFRNRFKKNTCQAFVMAVDIRRSTDLMLKARSPQKFAGFITALCADLMKIITDHYGVFDKFTGDGVLAFFPDFYSGDGKDAAYHVIAAADDCHAKFCEHYRNHRRSFTSILTSVGLGIGIDYGAVHLVQMAGGLTVVGTPVVYACRLSGAPSGITLANQPAYDNINDLIAGDCFIKESELDIKHEGSIAAYDVRLNTRAYTPKAPEWVRSEDAGEEMPVADAAHKAVAVETAEAS